MGGNEDVAGDATDRETPPPAWSVPHAQAIAALALAWTSLELGGLTQFLAFLVLDDRAMPQQATYVAYTAPVGVIALGSVLLARRAGRGDLAPWATAVAGAAQIVGAVIAVLVGVGITVALTA